MGAYRFGATNAPENEGLEGRLVAEVAAERGLDDFACVAEASAAEDFDLDFWPVRPIDPNDDPSYRVRLWESPDVLIGGSDAGAHLDHLLGSAYPTRFLADVLRGSRLLPLERAVRLMTDVPARLFGLRDRGRVAPGWLADLAVLDPETVGSRRGAAYLRPARRRVPPDGRARGRRARPRQRRRDDQRRRAHRCAGGHDPARRTRHHRHRHQLSEARMASDFVPSEQVARIRRRLTHPVIDADGHLAEFMPMVVDCMREVADDAVAERFVRFRRSPFTSGEGYLPTRVFFGSPPTLDRMTVMLPKLLYRRLEEIGLDFALLYPTSGLSVLSNPDDELRQAAARALNTYYARVFAEYRDRLEPVAVIPTFSPTRRWPSSTTRSAPSASRRW